MENNTTGIKWLHNTTFEDLDFADNIAFLSHSYNEQQIKTSSLSTDKTTGKRKKVDQKKSYLEHSRERAK